VALAEWKKKKKVIFRRRKRRKKNINKTSFPFSPRKYEITTTTTNKKLNRSTKKQL
jgi:hypothetical protein